MTKQELIRRLEDIEWQDFEVKEAKSELPKNVWQTVSAFCNTAGGWLILGVSKKGKEYSLVGVDKPEKIEQDFFSALRSDKFNRKIKAKPKKWSINGKTLFGFNIPSVYPKDKPIYYNALVNTFIRTGSGDQRATKEEIDAMYRNSSFNKKDEEPTRYNFKDLDKETITRYRTYLKSIDPEHRYNEFSAERMLELMQVITDGKVTVGGVLVFGKEEIVNRVVSDFRVEYLEVMGMSFADAPNRYEYRMPAQKNLYEYYFAVFDKLLKHIHIPFKLKGLSRDENQPQVTAIREALVNLLMHTDYFSNAKPRIRVLSDRIEFFNPGSLPKAVKYILKEEFSMPRNHTIARIFRTIRLSENIGSGFHKMFSGWTAYYIKKPIVEGDFDYYKISFYLDKKPQGEGVSEGVSEGVNSLIEFIKNNPGNRTPYIEKSLKVPKKTLERWLGKLKAERKIEFQGSDKTGGYYFIEKKD